MVLAQLVPKRGHLYPRREVSLGQARLSRVHHSGLPDRFGDEFARDGALELQNVGEILRRAPSAPKEPARADAQTQRRAER